MLARLQDPPTGAPSYLTRQAALVLLDAIAKQYGAAHPESVVGSLGPMMALINNRDVQAQGVFERTDGSGTPEDDVRSSALVAVASVVTAVGRAVPTALLPHLNATTMCVLEATFSAITRMEAYPPRISKDGNEYRNGGGGGGGNGDDDDNNSAREGEDIDVDE